MLTGMSLRGGGPGYANPSIVESETRVDYETTTLERDAMFGSGALEIALTKALTAP